MTISHFDDDLAPPPGGTCRVMFTCCCAVASEKHAAACGATDGRVVPQLLQSAAAETELMIEQGQVVVLKTGFVLLEGSQTEQRLHDGFQMWLEFSGAGGFGVPVGNGFVKISHTTEYAEKDDSCESYHAAARRLIEQQVKNFPHGALRFSRFDTWRCVRCAHCAVAYPDGMPAHAAAHGAFCCSVVSYLCADLNGNNSIPYVQGKLVSHLP